MQPGCVEESARKKPYKDLCATFIAQQDTPDACENLLYKIFDRFRKLCAPCSLGLDERKIVKAPSKPSRTPVKASF